MVVRGWRRRLRVRGQEKEDRISPAIINLETPLLDHELRKFAVWYDYNNGTNRVTYFNGTVAENRLNGTWVQTEPDGSTHEASGVHQGQQDERDPHRPRRDRRAVAAPRPIPGRRRRRR